MNHLLVPTDFSPTADNALRYAIELAKRMDSDVTIFHAYHFVSGGMGGSVAPTEFEQQVMLENEEEVKQSLEELRAKFAKEHYLTDGKPLRIHTQSVFGLATDAVKEAAASNQYSMIVMGTKGASGLAEVVWGSITAGVIDHVDLPLIAVPHDAQFEGLNSIVYATNFDANDVDIIDGLRDFAACFDAEIVVVHVVRKAADGDHAGEKMDTLQNNYWFTPVDKMDFELIRDHSVEHGLMRYVKDHNISMVAVMPQQRGFFGKMFHASVSKALAHHAEKPLLILRP